MSNSMKLLYSTANDFEIIWIVVVFENFMFLYFLVPFRAFLFFFCWSAVSELALWSVATFHGDS